MEIQRTDGGITEDEAERGRQRWRIGDRETGLRRDRGMMRRKGKGKDKEGHLHKAKRKVKLTKKRRTE